MEVIIAPLITEKSMAAAGEGKFTFKVAKDANKMQIKSVVEKNFEVHVTHVTTSILKGRSIRVGTRRTEKPVSDWKKAIVTVKKGEKIGLFELGGDEKK
jgi:large subunit ribosomal protein L23